MKKFYVIICIAWLVIEIAMLFAKDIDGMRYCGTMMILTAIIGKLDTED